MPGTLSIPKYTSKDSTIMVASMLPMAILLNYYLFDNEYFTSLRVFIMATVAIFVFLGSAFFTYGIVAISLRNRFPEDKDLAKRLIICISIFFLMSAVYISLLLFAFEQFHFLNYVYNENDFLYSYVTLIVINVFLTFLNEGIYRFEKYRAIITETEQLKKEYIHSQLIGLKSQMNPHFLFNSLNTLSCLIHDDPDKAEEFLDNMSKVFRYMLRQNETELVTVETELNFIRSYYSLLKARHDDALQLTIHVGEEVKNMLIPPLTLQMIGEVILTRNSLSRSSPLYISVSSEDGKLQIKSTLQPRVNPTYDCCDVLDNINNKYCLLCQQPVRIMEDGKEQTIELPLIPNTEMAVA